MGVIIGGVLLKGLTTPEVLSKCLAAVGGIMACISIQELLPTSIAMSGAKKASISLFIGMFVCFLALESVETFFGGHSHAGHSHSANSHGHSHSGHSHGHSHSGHNH